MLTPLISGTISKRSEPDSPSKCTEKSTKKSRSNFLGVLSVKSHKTRWNWLTHQCSHNSCRILKETIASPLQKRTQALCNFLLQIIGTHTFQKRRYNIQRMKRIWLPEKSRRPSRSKISMTLRSQGLKMPKTTTWISPRRSSATTKRLMMIRLLQPPWLTKCHLTFSAKNRKSRFNEPIVAWFIIKIQ